MSKAQKTVTVSRCSNHMLSLTPLNSDCYFNKRITAELCQNSGTQIVEGSPRKRQLKTRNQKCQCKCLNAPVFNRDGNYASPGFALPGDRNYYIQSYMRIICQHERNMDVYRHQDSELCVPRPRTKCTYCSVCRENYQQYISHIGSSRHKEKVKASPFNNHIIALEKHFELVNPRPVITHVVRKGQKNQDNTRYQSCEDEEVQIIEMSRPRKIVKKQTFQAQQNLHYYNRGFQNYNFPRYPIQPFYLNQLNMHMNMPMVQNLPYTSPLNIASGINFSNFLPYQMQFLPYPMNLIDYSAIGNWGLQNNLMGIGFNQIIEGCRFPPMLPFSFLGNEQGLALGLGNSFSRQLIKPNGQEIAVQDQP